MKVIIFIVTFGRDFRYLNYCLVSIAKFATGFHEVVILVPDQNYSALISLVKVFEPAIRIRCYRDTEWPDKGMLWHEAQIMRSDEWCPDADYIAHLDSDCIFTAPVTPDTFFDNGKPLLRYETFASIDATHPGDNRWKQAVESCVPFTIDRDFMRGHPEVYHRGLYLKTRELIAKHTDLPMDVYVRAQRNEYPQTVCEFCTLGAVAFNVFHDLYSIHDCGSPGENYPFNTYPVFQAWSHSAPDVPANLWWKGVQQLIKPVDVFNEVLFDKTTQ